MMLATGVAGNQPEQPILQILASFTTGTARMHEGVIDTVLQSVLASHEFTGLDDLDPTLNCLNLAAFDFLLEQNNIGWEMKAMACSIVRAHK